MAKASSQARAPTAAAGAATAPRSRRSAAPPQRTRTAASPASVEAGGPAPAVISVDEASATYRDDWILMRMTGLPGDPNAMWGEVLIHSPHRKDITKVVKLAHKQDPRVELFVFHGGMRSLKGDELRTALEEAAKGPYVNAFW